MNMDIEKIQDYKMRTLDGRTIVLKQSVDRHGHPIIVIDTYSADVQLQSTVKIGFKDIGTLRLALQHFGDAMLNSMCDY